MPPPSASVPSPSAPSSSLPRPVTNHQVLKRDSVGATVFHMAYILKRYKIARYLVQRYPMEALSPYAGGALVENDEGEMEYMSEDDMPYTGQNILHITVIFKNIAETRWLLDFYRNHEHSAAHGLESLLIANAKGRFFDIQENPEFYFGGFPLLFAVCSGDPDMFDLVLSYASR